MGFEVTTIAGEKEKEQMAGAWTSDRRLWLDKNGAVVEDGDPAAASLLCAAGRKIDPGTVERYDLKDKPAPTAAKPKPAAKPKAKAKE